MDVSSESARRAAVAAVKAREQSELRWRVLYRTAVATCTGYVWAKDAYEAEARLKQTARRCGLHVCDVLDAEPAGEEQ